MTKPGRALLGVLVAGALLVAVNVADAVVTGSVINGIAAAALIVSFGVGCLIGRLT